MADFHPPDRFGEHKLDFAAAHFFVQLHRGKQALGLGGVEFHLGWQTRRRKNGRDPVHVRGRQAGQFTGNLSRRHLADADGFAVQIFAVLRNRFQTVSDGVAEVEDRTQTGLFSSCPTTSALI